MVPLLSGCRQASPQSDVPKQAFFGSPPPASAAAEIAADKAAQAKAFATAGAKKP